jgi:hypothetical protein
MTQSQELLCLRLAHGVEPRVCNTQAPEGIAAATIDDIRCSVASLSTTQLEDFPGAGEARQAPPAASTSIRRGGFANLPERMPVRFDTVAAVVFSA